MSQTEKLPSHENRAPSPPLVGSLSPLGLLGLSSSLPTAAAQSWATTLSAVWTNQVGRPPANLTEDLATLEIFFNPTRKGEAVRTALRRIAGLRLDPAAVPECPLDVRFLLPAGSGRYLVTPEGRVLMECLAEALARCPDAWIYFDHQVALWAIGQLLTRYRDISRHRLLDVITLLSGDSKQTMRPAVAGLLLVLLLNRNTAPERALRKFLDDRATARTLTSALAAIAAAYAQTFGGDADAVNAVDVYRGYAYGELARRLGESMVNTETELYLTDGDLALRRLTDDIASRSAEVRARVPAAVDAVLAAYADRRPILSALGVAYERPSYTSRVAEAVRLASQDPRP